MPINLFYIIEKFDGYLLRNSGLFYNHFISTCVDAGTYFKSSNDFSGATIKDRSVKGTYAILASNTSFDNLTKCSSDIEALNNYLGNSIFHLEIINKTDLVIALKCIRGRGFFNYLIYDFKQDTIFSSTEIDNVKTELVLEACFELHRFLEVISYDVCKMGIEYLKENKVSVDNEYPNLQQCIQFANTLLLFCDYNSDGLCPSFKTGKIEYDINWNYALLHDTGYNTNVNDSFIRNAYVGWKVEFFKDLESIKRFIKDNPDYSSYSLYQGYNKIPLKIRSNKGTYLSLGEEVTVDLTE